MTSTNDDQYYFLEEGCAIFALALHKLLGKGEFYIYADTSNQADKWRGSNYEFTHVLLKIENKLYDVMGIRNLVDLAKEFNKQQATMQLVGPYSKYEFCRKFVGSSDNKPFYPPDTDTTKEAIAIIKNSTWYTAPQ